jgi:hypothetical protein
MNMHTDLGIAGERARLWALRAAVEATLEEMIDLLDRIDGDPDLEADSFALDGTTVDARLVGLDPDLEGDDADLEPLLGSLDGEERHTRWSAGASGDEFQCEDEGVTDSGCGDLDGLQEQGLMHQGVL